LANGKLRTFSTRDGLPNDEITGMYPTADGTLWIKTQNSDVARWRHGRFEPLSVPGIEGGTVRAVLLDRDGNFWIGSGIEGLFRLSGKKLSQFTTKHGLSSDAVACLYETRDGSLWVGTTSGGLERFRDGSFTTFAKEEGLASDQAYSVLEDRAGDIWATTDAGLNQLNAAGIHVYRTGDKLLDTWALLLDHASNLLVGTSSKGLLRLTKGQLVPMLSERDGVPGYHISAIVEDDAHTLWLATRGGGLVGIGDGKTTVFSKSNGLRSNVLFSLIEGADGTLWMGSDDGLNSLKDGRITTYETPNALADAWVISLYLDSKNILWIGTFGRGLFRLENGHFTHYTTHQGLPDDTVNSVVEDAAGNLWIGSDHGISRVTRQDMESVAMGTRPVVKPTVFGKADGIKRSETAGGSLPSAWRARDGRLWFPTNRGVVVVDPMRLSFNEIGPSAHVEEIVADQTRVNMLAPLRLAPGTRRLEIRYAAPSLSSPERTKFRYRLDGFDTQWVPGGAQRLAEYTNLSPGHYTFHVSASSETGQWGAQEATIGFDLIPQFYQTWWFELLCAIAASLLIWGVYRLRVNWLHARAAVLEERQRIAGEIHDSLAQGLSGIIFQTEAALLNMRPGIAATRVTTAHDLAKTSLDDARYSVWDLSPPILDKKNLVESLSSMAQQFARGRVEELDIHSSGPTWITRPEANHHVVLIAQEAISNAIQHGHARTINITLTYVTDGLHLSVSDDGQGFTPNPGPQQRGRGYGMRNMHHRAKRLGATLEIASVEGNGTQVFLRVPRIGRFTKLWQRLIGKSIAVIDG
jgi:signal transduction histidine kinase/streptogramin lyase